MTIDVEAPVVSDTIVLRGVLTRADHETYKELPFDVPAGIDRVTVEFALHGPRGEGGHRPRPLRP